VVDSSAAMIVSVILAFCTDFATERVDQHGRKAVAIAA
jgi:hypothetical protein